MPVIS